MGFPAVTRPCEALDRHQRRRDAGQPTVTVLVGPGNLAAGEGPTWADRRGRATVVVVDPRAGTMADSWAVALASRLDLARAVVERLAGRRGEDPATLGPRIARMGSVERGLFLDAEAPGTDDRGVHAAGRWILERVAAREDLAVPGLAARLGGAIGGADGDPPEIQALVALGSLIPPGSAPVLLAAPPSDLPATPGWVAAAARSLALLALAWPGLPALLCVPPADLDAYLRDAPESREKALIRSGIVAVTAPPAGEIGPKPAEDGPTPPPESHDDRARSESERFVFRMLESSPATSGLFELNATVAIMHGPGRAMEVDLLARAARIAIEIDGYHHFQGPDSYRRDRRKDVLLQRGGYLVIRVLAEDVVPRLEEILALIRDVLSSRLPRPDGPIRDVRP